MDISTKWKHRRKAATARGAVSSVAVGLALGVPAIQSLAVTPGDIVLGDITVMRLRTASGGVSAEQRASMVQERVNKFLAIPGLKAHDVRVVPTHYGPTIYVRKIKIITVDPETAKDQNVTPIVLAKTWAHRLMGVIDQVDIRVPGGPPAATPGVPAGAGTPAVPPTATPQAPPTPGATPPATPPAAGTPGLATPPAPGTPVPAAPTTPVPPPATPVAPPASGGTPASPGSTAPATPPAPAAPPAAPAGGGTTP